MAPRSSSTSPKILILVRHAHRNKTGGPSADNGLSTKGKRQARRLAAYFRRRFGKKKKAIVLSSPKLRCLETVIPLARAAKTPVEVEPRLNEMGGNGKESSRQFGERITEFARWWREEAPPFVVACSHGDWIPEALAELTGASLDLKKGGWAEVVLEDGKPRLVWLMQDFAAVEK